ncbi:MAG: UDP-N-acetylmuramoyl-tripeptide--D-alanyl-D-alanine ligase [Aureispira sp.]
MNTLYHYYQQHPVVFIDTRKKVVGGIFVAVGQKDERGCHRGNAFAHKALASGQAAYAFINDPALKKAQADDPRYVLVEDGEKALQELAQAHLKQLDCRIIAIAGSNGKTTFKELLHQILCKKYHVFSTQGNLNNHLGVPLSVLSLTAEHELAILELGANHLGETRFLAELVQPDYGVVTNCGKDHLGEYGSVENIIKANKELYDVLAEGGKTAFVQQDNALLLQMATAVQKKIMYGGATSTQATVVETPFLKINLQLGEEEWNIQSQLFGAFWIETLLGVAAVGHYFEVSGVAIKAAIEAYHPAALRSEQITWQNHRVLLDCYNANPSSMQVFLQAIQESNLQGNKVLVLGEMGELGAYSAEEHQALLEQIAWEQYQTVYAFGAAFLEINLPKRVDFKHFLDRTPLKIALAGIDEPSSIFVKGSRSNRLEALFQ